MAKTNIDTVTHRRSTLTLPDGTEVTVQSLGLRDFTAAREQALQSYRREQIQSWTANADLMPQDQRDRWIREAFDRAAAITADALPLKRVRMPKKASDGTPLTRDGKPVMEETEVEYAMWWLSETTEGQVYAAWLSMRKVEGQQDWTLAKVDDILCATLGTAEKVAQRVGELSEPRLAGNEHAPPTQDSEGKTPATTPDQ